MNVTSNIPHQHIENKSFTVVINKEWQVSLARRKLNMLAVALGYNVNSTAELVTAMSELAYNLFFHANSDGEVTVSVINSVNKTGISIMTRDSGPGIASIEKALADGFSTNGGLGGGLPGTKRLMDEFTISSTLNGTLITCVKWLS
jgi:serine/threonine-protein kinase RsbT